MSGAPEFEFDDVVRDHSGMVARISATYENRPALIEELAQEVFLAVYRALPSFRGEASLKTFIARIANNVGVDHVRRASRKPREAGLDVASTLPDPDSDHETDTDLALKREKLVAAVRGLEISLRQVVSLHLEGFSNTEIAEALSISPNNAGVRLHRARSELAAILAADAPKESAA